MAVEAAPGHPGAVLPGGYSWEVILARANTWADIHGYPKLTRDTLIEFRRDGLVPGPLRGGRGPGRGRGAAWGWSALAYSRVLRLIKLRASGFTARRVQRSILFAGGARLDIRRVRTDLRSVYGRNAARINRDYGTEFITPNSPTPARLADEVRFVLNPELLEKFLATEARGFPEQMKVALREIMASPAASEVVEVALRQVVLPDPNDTLPQFRRAIGALPPQLARVLSSELEDAAATMSGLLAHPDTGNAIVEGLDQLTDEELITVRDYALAWSDLTLAFSELLRALPMDRETEELRPLADMIASFPARMSPPDRLMLLGFFIARARAVTTFLSAAQPATKMRVGPVIREMARRGLVRSDVSSDEIRDSLTAAGVEEENWHLWLNESAS